MSNMIPTGHYKIQNVMYSERYIAMAEPGDNYEVVGHDVADIIRVEVTDPAYHLATLYDMNKWKYMHVENVVGGGEPQVLQLPTEDGEDFTIHEAGSGAWVLINNRNWTPITTASAPPPGVDGYKKIHWKFVPAS